MLSDSSTFYVSGRVCTNFILMLLELDKLSCDVKMYFKYRSGSLNAYFNKLNRNVVDKFKIRLMTLELVSEELRFVLLFSSLQFRLHFTNR